ncbi:MAG: hypothetical protein VYC34_09925, partial [Planctomycetota bacterium]|nr:hypothetical protein [Planctomycetota bacterium]
MVSTATPPTTRPAGPRPAGAPAGPPGPGQGGITLDPRKLFLQYWPWLIGSVIAGLVLGTAAHFAFAKFYPLYDGEVYFEVFAMVEDPGQQRSTVGAGQEPEIERFIGTQINRMLSEPVLRASVIRPAVRNDTR